MAQSNDDDTPANLSYKKMYRKLCSLICIRVSKEFDSMDLIKCFIFALLANLVYSNSFEVEKNSLETLLISKTVVKIARTFEFGTNPVVTLIRSVQNDSVINDSCSEIASTFKKSIAVEVQNLNQLKKTKNSRLFNIFLMRNSENLKTLIDHYDNKILDFNGYLIIVLLNNSDSRMQTVHSIIDDLWEDKILRVIVITFGSKHDEVDVYAGFPYQYGLCNKIEVRKIPVTRGRHYQAIDKFHNMNNCLLNVSFALMSNDSYQGYQGHFAYDDKLGKYVGIDVSFFESELIISR